MCGGYQILMDAGQLQCVHGETNWRPGHAERYSSRASVRPTTFAPVIVRGTGASNELVMMKWGLVPSWTRPDARNRIPLLTNARSETVVDLPSFASLKNKVSRRCVVPSTGFFEWEAGPTKSARKVPYLIKLGTPGDARETLFMAGIYDVWKPPGGEELHTFTICTTGTNPQFEWLHHRLPCILESQQDVDDWLNVGELPGPEAVKKVLRTTSASLVWTQMSSDLQNAVGNPSSKRTKPDIKSFFKKGTKEEKPAASQSLAAKTKSLNAALKTEPQSPSAKQRKEHGTPKRGGKADPKTELLSPIAKRRNVDSTPRKGASKPTPKSSPKREIDRKQKSITSFFRKAD